MKFCFVLFPPEYSLCQNMTNNFDQNVSRPDGYNSLEKLMSWARIGWSHAPVYCFLAICLVASVSGIAGLQYVIYHPLQVWFKIDYNEIVRVWDRWINEICPVLAVPLALISGVAVTKLGTFRTLVCANILSIALTPILWKAATPAMLVAGWTLTNFWLLPSVSILSFLFCYEATPIKWRVPCIFLLSLLESLASLVFGVANTLSGESVKLSELDFVSPSKFAAALNDALGEARYQFCFYFIFGTLGIALLAALLLRRDSCISLVCRNRVEEAFEQLFKQGANSLTNEPLPMTETEFIANAETELKVSLSSVAIFRRAMLPLALLMLASLALNIADLIFATNYYFKFEDLLGEGYSYNMFPGMLARYGAASVGLLLGLAMWFKMKDIRFIPAVGVFCMGIGGLVLSTIKVLDSSGYPLETKSLKPSSSSIIIGVLLMTVGQFVLKACVQILVMDLFSNKSRGNGLFVFKAVDLICYALCYSAAYYLKTANWFFVLHAAVITVVGCLMFAAFYMTSWFDHSMLFRDPETDACWLVSGKVSSTNGYSYKDSSFLVS